jgi:L-fuconolactonase
MPRRQAPGTSRPEVVDVQVHRPLPRVPWPRFDSYAGYPREGGDVLPTEPSNGAALEVGVELMAAQMEAVGVDAGIVYSNPDFCEAAVARHPGTLAAVHDHYEPADLGDPAELMAAIAADPGLLGIRILPGIDYAPGHNLELFTAGAWDPTFAAAAAHGVPVVVFIPFGLRHVHRVARGFPELKLVIDHCGMPAPPTAPPQEDNFATLPDLLELARYPNLAVKLTGMPVLAPGGDAYPFPKLWPHLHQLLDAFGPERLLWGTDAQRVTGRVWEPPLRVPGYEQVTYAELVDWLRYTDEVGPAEKVLMLGGAARHWFGWPATAVEPGSTA